MIRLEMRKVSKAVQVCLIVYSALFLNFFLVGSITPLVPQLAKDHGLSDYERSIILSAKSFAHMTASPIVAVLSYRISTQIIFSFGVFCICGAFAGIAFASTVVGFVAARSVQGIGVASIMVAGMSILVMAVPKEKRGKYTSFAYSALGHSTLISPLLSGLMYDRLGQMWTFLIPGIATFFAAIISVIVLSRLDTTYDQPVSISIVKIKGSVLSILTYPLSYISFIGIMSAGVSFGCFESTVPAILLHQLNSVIKTNLMWSIGPLMFTILAPILGYLIDKFGPIYVFISGLFFYAIFYPLFSTIAVNIAGLGAIVALAFACEAILEVSVYPIMAAVVDARQPAATLTIAYALNEVFIQCGFAIGDILGDAIHAWRGLLAMGAIMGGWNGVLAIVFLLLIRTKWFSQTPIP